jgi:hypothetical protein
MCQAFNVFGQPLSLDHLKRLDDPGMERTSAFLEEAAIGDLVGQGMLEGEFALGEEPRLIEKLGGLQVGKAVVEYLLGHVGNGLQEWQGHLGANHGSRLQEALLLGR